ncbi:unnamed protein product [Hydatigera taeniaeformis]|uniref:Ig-like domain-containing protein n=1 Tax=Hydatigena taeniaeformis TaxID=6205 RepID=A0A158REV2_HYDTA|nr:unnamed protein product [Hydatigera taeniaeformis]
MYIQSTVIALLISHPSSLQQHHTSIFNVLPMLNHSPLCRQRVSAKCIASSILFFHLLIFAINAVSANDPAVAATLQQRITHRRGYLVPLNTQITLSCPFETPFYKWTRPDYPSHFLDETKNLTINADSFDVSGRYQCSAVNGFGNSLAEMAIRVVDYNSPAIKEECALLRDGKINTAGPCFLRSYTDSELVITRYWGEDVTFDCSSVTADGRTYQLDYAWEFYKQGLGKGPSSSTMGNRLIRRSNTRGAPPGGGSPVSVGATASVGAGVGGSGGGGASSNAGVGGGGGRADVARFSESQLTIRKVTLSNMGEYRCTVTNPAPDSSSSVIPKIERTFQLHVIPRSEGAIIIGDHDITMHVKSGENLIQSCKVNSEQHRTVTIRWGKIIEPSKAASAYEGGGKEIIRLSNIAFIVFPLMPTNEASNKLTSSTPSVSGPFAVSDPGSPESQLVIQRVTGRDAGVYICSVITESGWDDRKLVRVVVSDAQTEPSAETFEENSYPRRLALYIAAPVIVFFVCIFIISYCLINRKSRRCSQLNGSGHTRATLPVMRQIGNSNNSVSIYRSGLNGPGITGKTNTTGLIDHHMGHHSPQGPPSSAVTAPAAAAAAAAATTTTNNNNSTNTNNSNHVAYSSSTGSHSLSGTSAGTPGSMLLANTMVQVLPPDGSGYPLLKPNGHHHHHHQPPPQSQVPPPPPHSTYDPYNTSHMSNGVSSDTGVGGPGAMMYMPSAYRDFQA